MVVGLDFLLLIFLWLLKLIIVIGEFFVNLLKFDEFEICIDFWGKGFCFNLRIVILLFIEVVI